MTEEPLPAPEPLAGPAETASEERARAQVYLWLSRAYSFPSEEGLEALAQLERLTPVLFPDLCWPEWDVSGEMPPPSTARKSALESPLERLRSLEAEYIVLFDGAEPKRAVHPYEALWYPVGGAQRRWEVLQFYRCAGLEPDASRREQPDHVVLELEFMAALCQALGGEGEVSGKESRPNSASLPGPATLSDWQASLRLARQDFFRRHLADWVPRFTQGLEARTRLPAYKGLARFTARFLAEEFEAL